MTASPGTPVTITVTPPPARARDPASPVAQATVTIGGEVHRIALVASRAVQAPSTGSLLAGYGLVPRQVPGRGWRRDARSGPGRGH